MEISYKIAKEINKLRANPKDYSHQLYNYRNYYENSILKLPDFDVGIKTEEGRKACDEAINFLENQKEIFPLNPIPSLFKISKDYLSEIQKIDYSEIDNIDIEKIIKKYGDFYGDFSRIIEFGYQDPEIIVDNLIVNDGDPKRSKRNILMNQNLYNFGVAFGEHSFFQYCTVALFCTEFISIDSSNDENIDFENENQ